MRNPSDFSSETLHVTTKKILASCHLTYKFAKKGRYASEEGNGEDRMCVKF
ncbi:hypothetical protein KDA_45540 [Dictyobacter alpinus]|uniref:Uncharacterized protein n=1 Tax=Dictyobacter alpinus TaxID=2014873 RepID=A0A402BCN7_9CHLR|nr:hypothetical protein KDA_45540 [Dictyobacter alpinus]